MFRLSSRGGGRKGRGKGKERLTESSVRVAGGLMDNVVLPSHLEVHGQREMKSPKIASGSASGTRIPATNSRTCPPPIGIAFHGLDTA